MDNLTLIDPTAELKSEFVSMVEEYQAAGERRHKDIAGLIRNDFSEYIRRLENTSRGIGLSPGHVAMTIFWLVRDGAAIVGTGQLRHTLTPDLEHEGGHIGYNIRPSQRRKGYGTRLLGHLLKKARGLGRQRVLLTCDTDNFASARIIEKNGGRLDSDGISRKSGKPISRYWIEL